MNKLVLQTPTCRGGTSSARWWGRLLTSGEDTGWRRSVWSGYLPNCQQYGSSNLQRQCKVVRSTRPISKVKTRSLCLHIQYQRSKQGHYVYTSNILGQNKVILSKLATLEVKTGSLYLNIKHLRVKTRSSCPNIHH